MPLKVDDSDSVTVSSLVMIWGWSILYAAIGIANSLSFEIDLDVIARVAMVVISFFLIFVHVQKNTQSTKCFLLSLLWFGTCCFDLIGINLVNKMVINGKYNRYSIQTGRARESTKYIDIWVTDSLAYPYPSIDVANQFCSKYFNTSLASLHSHSDISDISNAMISNSHVETAWIGLKIEFDIMNNSQYFEWIDGTEYNYTLSPFVDSEYNIVNKSQISSLLNNNSDELCVGLHLQPHDDVFLRELPYLP